MTDPLRIVPQSESAHFVFRVGGRAFALPPTRIEQVVAPRQAIAIPTAARWFHGVTVLEGRLLPLVDMARLLGCDDSAASDATVDPRLVIADIDQQRFGFTVEASLGIWIVAEHKIARTLATAHPLFVGHFDQAQTTVSLVDHTALLSAIRGEVARG